MAATRLSIGPPPLHSLSNPASTILDLWLLRQPPAKEFGETIEAYKAFERLMAEGRVRVIGLSNPTQPRLELPMAEPAFVPAVNRIQVNPCCGQASHGILTQSQCPPAEFTAIAAMTGTRFWIL